MTPIEAHVAQEPAKTETAPLSDANLAAIIKMEHDHIAQQHRLLDIIAEQQNQIADLTRMLKEARRYDNIRFDEGCMVADRPTQE